MAANSPERRNFVYTEANTRRPADLPALRIMKAHSLPSGRFASIIFLLWAPLSEQMLTPAAAQPGSRLIAITGVPGYNGDGVTNSVGVPTLNRAGQITATVQLTGTRHGNVAVSQIVRFDRDGAPAPIAEQFQLTPENNGSRFESIARAALNDAGQVAFLASLDSAAGVVTYEGLYAGNVADNLHTISQLGDSTLGGGSTFQSFGPDAGVAVLNNSGQTTFRATFANPTGNGVFFGETTSPATPIAVSGQPAPDGNGEFEFFPRTSPLLNDVGHVVFRADLANTNGGGSDDEGLFFSDGDLTTLVRTGDATPGGSGVFTQLGVAQLNNQGAAAFTARFTSTSSGGGIFFWHPTIGLTPIAREQQSAPDGAGVFQRFESFSLNNNDQVAFVAEIPNGTRDGGEGLFVADSQSNHRLIVRDGQPLPDGDGQFYGFSQPIINDSGQIAFHATAFGAAGRPASDEALLFYNPNHELVQIARLGDPAFGSTITNLWFTQDDPGTSNIQNGFNDRGEVAYAFSLADGRQGIALWTPVPEPTSCLALLAAAGMATLRRTPSRLSIA